MNKQADLSGKGGFLKKLSKYYLHVIVVLILCLGVSFYFLKQEKAKNCDLQNQLAGLAVHQETEPVDHEIIDLGNIDKKVEEAEATQTEPKIRNTEGQGVDENSIVGKIALTLQNYYSADSPENKLKYVNHPDYVRELMQDYYSRKPFIPKEVKEVSQIQSFAFEGFPFWRVQVGFSDGGKGFAALRFIDGEPKVDWESEVRYSTMDWDKWVESKDEEEGIFRVYGIVDQYYPEPFSDYSRYVCVKLRHPDSSQTSFAYIDRRDEKMKSLLQMVAEGKLREYTLKLQRVKSGSPAALSKVVELVSSSWILVNANEGQDDK